MEFVHEGNHSFLGAAMDLISKRCALEILEYWKFVELLGQNDLISESDENKKLTEEVLKGNNIKENRIEVYRTLKSAEIDTAQMLEEDDKKYNSFEFYGDEITFCMGKIDRNVLCNYLKKYMGTTASEGVTGNIYPEGTAIAWFTFKTDINGNYINFSFRLSPILWAINERNEGSIQNLSYRLNKSTYDSIIRQFEYKLQGKNVSSFLQEIYLEVENQFLRADFENDDQAGILKYVRYNSKDSQEHDRTTKKAGFSYGTYSKDLTMFADGFANNTITDKTPFGKKLGEYILSAYQNTHGKPFSERTSISPNEDREAMRKFFEYALDIKKTPLGTLPCDEKVPCLSQVAINLITDESAMIPLFSVDSDGGKDQEFVIDEVVAAYVVRKAEQMAQNEHPDDAFDDNCRFINDKINDYGILIISDEVSEGEIRFSDRTDVDAYIYDRVLPVFEDENKPDYSAIRADFLDQCKKVRNMRASLGSLCKAQRNLPDYPRNRIEEELNILPRLKSEVDSLDNQISELENEIININSKKKSLLFSKRAEETKQALIDERQKRLDVLQEDREKKNKRYLSVKNYRASLDTLDKFEGKTSFVDHDFLDKFYAGSPYLPSPWITDEYDYEREKLYHMAIQFLNAFVMNSDKMKKAFLAYDNFDAAILQLLLVVTPAIVTDVHSAGRLLRMVTEKETIGQLFVDKSNEIEAQSIMGLMFRCRKATLFGGSEEKVPEPAFETTILKQALISDQINNYRRGLSAKFCADYVNPYGVYKGADNKEWSGFPMAR